MDAQAYDMMRHDWIDRLRLIQTEMEAARNGTSDAQELDEEERSSVGFAQSCVNKAEMELT